MRSVLQRRLRTTFRRQLARSTQRRVPRMTGGKLFAARMQPRRWSATVASAPTDMPRGLPVGLDMACFQCEQTKDTVACTERGVCGKTAEVSAVQDALVHACVSLSQVLAAYPADAKPANADEITRAVGRSMFATMTNVNFDEDALAGMTRDVLHLRNEALRGLSTEAVNALPEGATWPLISDPITATNEQLEDFGRAANHMAEKAVDADRHGLRQMGLYGVKGSCAYAEHAAMMNSPEAPALLSQACGLLARLYNPAADVAELTAAVLAVGEWSVSVLAALDAAHTASFGAPALTQVRTTPVEGPCILVSGHDVGDVERILEATEGTGVNVYTHGELLPAHSYPSLNKHKHLAGHFGGPWQLQRSDFKAFPGPVIMTSNCVIEPRKSYAKRLFTANVVGWPGAEHLDTHNPADLQRLIDTAKAEGGFRACDLPTKERFMPIGFGHAQVMQVADKIISGVKDGRIGHFFLVGGCDGSEAERSYYTDVAQMSPDNSVLLTLGCGKFRLNKLPLGTIPLDGLDLPRVVDMGQCNDSFSAIQVASALAKAFETDINGLPLSLVLSWFEQKAVAVLLALLHLGVKRIRVGPRPPAFITPNVLALLQKEFDLKLIGDAKQDMEDMLQGR